MVPSNRQRKPAKALSHGRPTVIQKPGLSKVSSQKGRALIRRHHTLQKEHAQAVAAADANRVTRLEKQLEEQGGIKSYQQASAAGQSSERGGDSSKTLMEWLSPVVSDVPKGSKLALLEVGALSTHNACSRSGLFDVTRIDLHSQDTGITQQDFMMRPVPITDAERFDCISLSLVLNYVPDGKGRGDMLRHATSFLVSHSKDYDTIESALRAFPSLFLVLPAPCVTNSRYMTEKRLEEIMHSLGFQQTFRKLSAKLVYYLWVYNGQTQAGASFSKTQVNPGRARNNFAVILN